MTSSSIISSIISIIVRTHVASGSDDTTVRLWDIEAREAPHTTGNCIMLHIIRLLTMIHRIMILINSTR